MYTNLQALLQTVEAEQGGIQAKSEAVQVFTQQTNWDKLVTAVQNLGRSTPVGEMSQVVRQAIHDIKSGTLTALAIFVQLMEMELVSESELQQLGSLIRDHLLIMRNSVRDLDQARFISDRQFHAQQIGQLTDGWANTTYAIPGHSAQVMLESDYSGDIGVAPIEFAALTRVFYNILNNAVKYSDDDHVYVSLLRLPDTDPSDVRFVVYNRISPEHHAALLKQYPNGFGNLFRGGFTTGGSGIGMRTCAEHVAGDYGLAKIEQCIEGGYVGAIYQHSYFVTWFHWPTARIQLQPDTSVNHTI